MDPVAAVMLDVARIVTFQAKVTNTENRRTARERELRSTEAAIADEPAPAAADMTKRQPARLPRFRFSLMSR